MVCLFLAPVFMLRGDMLGTVFHVNVGSVADATAVRFDVLMFNFDVHRQLVLAGECLVTMGAFLMRLRFMN